MNTLKNIVLPMMQQTSQGGNLTSVVSAVLAQNHKYTAVTPTSVQDVVTRLNINLTNLSLKHEPSATNSFSIYGGSDSLINANTPSLKAIMQKIKANSDDGIMNDTEVVERYLMDNFGGNKESVIKNLSGVSSLPFQAIIMQDQLFNQIVSKISLQAQDAKYNEKFNGTSSLSSLLSEQDQDSSLSSLSMDPELSTDY